MDIALVPKEFHGMRLDQALILLLPGSSIRQRRRLWENKGQVLVDGCARAKGYCVSIGQKIELLQQENFGALVEGTQILDIQGDFVSIFKPAGLHSAAIVGRENASLEQLLPSLLPGKNALLLNRLDQLTSGIVLVALTPEAAMRYYELEDAGYVIKEYVALVHGCLEWPVTVKNVLDTANTKKTKILGNQYGSPLRWTIVDRVDYYTDQNLTLVKAVIYKGARHQIRVHLAHILHPIVGDSRYGKSDDGQLFLHHSKLEFEGFVFQNFIDWA